ncbi:ABC transporter ATP-binding protein [Streptomyces jietaisiensis]|uniref:ABC transporter ATP-binding protein n=1 Tax=Streptomyces griseoaurantiacus TaxID=68213 RepID=A0ABZ1V8B7_9ACTN|nr:ABC transporter ATP-binding protein [Streptomyces jietaisiensis]
MADTDHRTSDRMTSDRRTTDRRTTDRRTTDLTKAASPAPVPTVICDAVDIVYRVNGTGAGRGAATAALNRMLRRKQPERAAGVRTVHAVRNVSFTAHRGEAIGLIGTNGSGKSTLLKAVAGLLPVERGRIYTDGQPSLLGVNAALMKDLTGERNVHLGGLAMGMSREEVRERHQQIVDFSGINEKGDFLTLPMRTYSSGMAARLRFSIAAAKDHDVLLVDEALATGDRSFQKRSERRIRELRAHAGTVFLVSHSNKSIRDTCDRVLWLERGELRMDGPTDEVLAAYEEFTGGPDRAGKAPAKRK